MRETFHQRWARKRAREARYTPLEKLWVYHRNMQRAWGPGWYLTKPARPLTSEQHASMQRFARYPGTAPHDYYQQRTERRYRQSMVERWLAVNGMRGGSR